MMDFFSPPAGSTIPPKAAPGATSRARLFLEKTKRKTKTKNLTRRARRARRPRERRASVFLRGPLWFSSFFFFISFFFSTALLFFVNRDYIKGMKQTVTIEIADTTVLPLLRSLAAMRLIRFTSDMPSQDDRITERLNEIYSELDSSLEPCYTMAQAAALGSEDW